APSRAGSAPSAIGSGLSGIGSTLWGAYLNLVERFQWKTIIATGIVFLLLVFLIVSGIRGYIASANDNGSSAADATQSTAATSTSTSAASASASSASTSSASSGSASISDATSPVNAIELAAPEIDETEIDETALVNILGDEYADQLIEQAKSNNDAHWIASHPDEYLEDGTIVRYKMLRLAAKEPESIPFVRDWPEKYCADEPDYTEDHVDETSNGVPRLYQWDKRWGYTEYSSTTFALTGCAPTSMAMVYQARTGDTSMSPYDMGVYAMQNGYATQFDGTDGSLFTYGAAGLGLTGTIIGNDGASLTQALANGQLVVVNVGPGDFTDSGHYFVATGLAPDGSVMINDPFSAVRSEMTWDADTIASQTKMMYAIS
ncbi:MAG: C39 family peptidase, partial [Eggerthellaceae bacterium]|nr:C39 family peptidase [Eggerthellaceae bacterium]